MNINQTILASDGHTEIYTFGGENAHHTTTYKGYFVSLEWFTGNRSTEPMLVIQRETRSVSDGAFGICLSSIGAYADPSGGPADGSLVLCWEALPVLGHDPSAAEAHRLLDVVLHFTPALIAMPPTPRSVLLDEHGGPLLEVTTKDENGRVLAEVTL